MPRPKRKRTPICLICAARSRRRHPREGETLRLSLGSSFSTRLLRGLIPDAIALRIIYSSPAVVTTLIARESPNCCFRCSKILFQDVECLTSVTGGLLRCTYVCGSISIALISVDLINEIRCCVFKITRSSTGLLVITVLQIAVRNSRRMKYSFMSFLALLP